MARRLRHQTDDGRVLLGEPDPPLFRGRSHLEAEESQGALAAAREHRRLARVPSVGSAGRAGQRHPLMPPRDLTGLVILIVVLGLAIWGGASRWSPRVTKSLGLLI